MADDYDPHKDSLGSWVEVIRAIRAEGVLKGEIPADALEQEKARQYWLSIGRPEADDSQRQILTRDPYAAWESEQRQENQARLRNPQPNDIIERRPELRDSGMEPEQIDRQLQRQNRSLKI